MLYNVFCCNYQEDDCCRWINMYLKGDVSHFYLLHYSKCSKENTIPSLFMVHSLISFYLFILVHSFKLKDSSSSLLLV